jgi:hypothetical protein
VRRPNQAKGTVCEAAIKLSTAGIQFAAGRVETDIEIGIVLLRLRMGFDSDFDPDFDHFDLDY